MPTHASHHRWFRREEVHSPLPSAWGAKFQPSKSQQPLQTHLAVMSCQFHPLRGTMARPRAPNAFQFPKTLVAAPVGHLWVHISCCIHIWIFIIGQSLTQWEQWYFGVPPHRSGTSITCFHQTFFILLFLLQKRAQLSSKKGNLMLHTFDFLIYWRPLDRCLNYLLVQRTLCIPDFPLRIGKDIFLYFKCWAKVVLNKGLRIMYVCDSFYIDTHIVHKNIASFKHCNIFGGGKKLSSCTRWCTFQFIVIRVSWV